MKKILNLLLLLSIGLLCIQCDDYLTTSSPQNTDDEFVTSSVSETFKTLSWCYANYRQNGAMGYYRYNDYFSSDSETYPEANSGNNTNAKMKPEDLTVDCVALGFNTLYETLARASKVAEIIATKDEYKTDLAAGKTTDWTQLYGEAMTIRAFCYFELIKHFGDVPYNYENDYTNDYSLNSRYEIFDAIITSLKDVAPLMYRLGEGGITAERFSRTFAEALTGEAALYAGGYQTTRTDIAGLYGDVQFVKIGSEVNGCVYARRTDYKEYYAIAAEYLQKSLDNAGSAYLITNDDRGYANNPFQMHFQYFHNLTVSPESFFEIGNIQGGQKGQTTTSEYPYAFGRPSKGGGSNSAPCKSFSSLRIIPTVYYGDYELDDKRRDASVAVTASLGNGNEQIISFKPGAKIDGGISINKWDENRMNPPYVASQRQSGINLPVLRYADVMLMLAETKAVLGTDNAGAINLVNAIRNRAFGNTDHEISGLSGDALLDAVLDERKLELLGEGTRRWDMIRNGIMASRAMEIRSEVTTMLSDVASQEYHQFANGNQISAYIYTKQVQLNATDTTDRLTYDCTDITDAARFPGWRGQYDYSSTSVAGKVVGSKHNVAIKGLFNYIDSASVEATTLIADGYTITPWANLIVENENTYLDNILSGLADANDPPRYYWPIPSETISGSKGKVTNGYGLPQQ